MGGAKPDVWLEPKIVWEVLTADLSISPVYTAAQGLVGAIGQTVMLVLTDVVRSRRGVSRCAFRGSSGYEMTSLQMMLPAPSRSVHLVSGECGCDPIDLYAQIAEMYERQALAQTKGGKKKGGDADDGFW